MRAVVQRVTGARVRVADRTVGEIEHGLLVLLGVADDDGVADVQYIVNKVRELRIFDDDEGKMNRTVVETGGAVLVVSQFTVCGDARRGRRPSFDSAAPPALARALYEDVVRELRGSGLTVATGEFQARMAVELINEGPVTILLDSKKVF